MNLFVIITPILIMAGIYWFSKFRQPTIKFSEANIGAMITERLSNPYPGYEACDDVKYNAAEIDECVDWKKCDDQCFSGQAICSGKETCDASIIKGSAACIGVDSCRKSIIEQDAYCAGPGSCKEATIKGNAYCNAESCEGAKISGIIKIISTANKEIVKIVDNTKVLQCTEADCKEKYIDGNAICHGPNSCIQAVIKPNDDKHVTHCKGSLACKDAAILGNAFAICDGDDSCIGAFIFGDVCCNSLKACQEITTVGTKTISRDLSKCV